MKDSDFPAIFSLKGELAVVTGGGTGIGQAIAQAMHAAGARVVLVGRREPELAAAVKTMGEGAAYAVHDITVTAETDALVQRITKEHGSITCLVNNAGRHLKKAAVDTTPKEFLDVLNTHIIGAHELTRLVIPGMVERKHGCVLFTASMASLFGIPLVVAYASAKSAMLGMVRTLSTELSPHGIRVNAIAPGWIDTDMSRKAFAGDPARKSKIISRTPMAKLGDVADVGWAAVYLASPAAKFVTGAVLPVDGGVSMGF